MSTTNTPTPAQLSRQRLAEARENTRQCKHEAEEAREALDNLNGRLRRGDATVSVEALAAAELRVRRADTLLDAALRTEKIRERSVITDTPDIAEALVGTLQDAFGVSVWPDTEKPSKPTRGLNAPRLYVIQTKPSVSTGGGFVSGEVTLYWERNEFMIALTDTRVEEALKPLVASVNVRPASSSKFGENVLDRITLDVRSVAPDPMVIRGGEGGQTSSRLHYFRQGIEALFERAVESPYLNERGGVKAKADVRLVSEETDRDGMRSLKVACEVQSWPYRKNRGRERADAAQSIGEHLSNYVGHPVAGLGRVASVTGMKIEAGYGYGKLDTNFTVELVCKVTP